MSQSDRAQLVRYYAALSDEALITASRNGPSGFSSDEWSIVESERARRFVVRRILLDGRYEAVVRSDQSASPGIPAVAFRGRLYGVGHVIQLPDGKGVLASDYLPAGTPRVHRESLYKVSLPRLLIAAVWFLAVLNLFAGLPAVLALGVAYVGMHFIFSAKGPKRGADRTGQPVAGPR